MHPIEVGHPVPSLSFQTTNQAVRSFADLFGKNIVLYFYPKDNTPGCTVEASDFSQLIDEFRACNAEILGVSRDSLNSHQKFCQKRNLKITLISDPEEKLCKAFNVLKDKTLFSKIYVGIERSTFLINTKGTIEKIWRPVKVRGHAQHVLDYLKSTEHKKFESA